VTAVEAALKTYAGRSQVSFLIDDESKVGEARRAAQTLANFEFDTETAGRVAIVATELANNLLRHAGGGELLLQTLGTDGSATVEILAVDRGPGMSSVEHCMRDGYSTGGTMGTGLGAVRRLADEFDIHSIPGHGTVVMARFGKGLKVRHGAISIPMHGEVSNGDAWHVTSDGEYTAVIVVDGLGHGLLAGEAAQAGVSAFLTNPYAPPKDIMLSAGAAMSKTRGGAAACALIRGTSLDYAGVGNISGALVSKGRSQGLVSHAGTLGMRARRSQQFVYQREPGMLLVMHSDGLSARWNLREQPDLLGRHPAIIAAVLYRDHGRNRDDATVVVIA
jgi:anti-sigma regulatory factor (Ser/Thr protein kinase)